MKPQRSETNPEIGTEKRGELAQKRAEEKMKSKPSEPQRHQRSMDTEGNSKPKFGKDNMRGTNVRENSIL